MNYNSRKEARHSMRVQIEFEDSNYTYISSVYPWKSLKGDVEHTKVPINIMIHSTPSA